MRKEDITYGKVIVNNNTGILYKADHVENDRVFYMVVCYSSKKGYIVRDNEGKVSSEQGDFIWEYSSADTSQRMLLERWIINNT